MASLFKPLSVQQQHNQDFSDRVKHRAHLFAVHHVQQVLGQFLQVIHQQVVLQALAIYPLKSALFSGSILILYQTHSLRSLVQAGLRLILLLTPLLHFHRYCHERAYIKLVFYHQQYHSSRNIPSPMLFATA